MTLADLTRRQLERRRLAHLALACVAVLALFALVACGPSDSAVESSVAVSGETTTTTTPRVRIAALDGGPVIFATTTTSPPTTAAPAPRVPPPSAPVTTPPTTTAPAVLTAPAPAPGGECNGWGGLVAAYFPASQVAKACSVMACESQGNPRAASPTNDHGLFQLHAGSSGFPGGWQAKFREVTGAPFFDGVYDPELNVRFAAWLYGQSGWRPWACA